MLTTKGFYNLITCKKFGNCISCNWTSSCPCFLQFHLRRCFSFETDRPSAGSTAFRLLVLSFVWLHL